jgi:glycosyltransferase involved in cell wall biosynthesis
MKPTHLNGFHQDNLNQNHSVTALPGKRAAVVVFSHYPSDPRPRRAAEALVQQGMSVDVICLKHSQDDPTREVFNGVNILRVPLQRQRGGKFTYMFQYSAFILISFLLLATRSLLRRYQLVHVHNMPDVLVFSALVPKLLGARVVLDIHDPMPELMMSIYGFGENSRAVRLLKRTEKWSLGFADVVLTVNLCCKKILSGRSCPADKVHVVMNSPDEGIFQYQPGSLRGEERDPATPFVIMYHGSIVERHGLDVAVEALGMIRKSIPNAELRVYGQKTPFLEQVMSGVAESDLKGAVRYLGPKKLEQIVGAIDECHVGIIPNRRNIFTELNTPTRIFEYLSRGKPVIAPRAAGITDYFDAHQLVYFELGNAGDLARRLQYVHAHPGEAEKIVRRGQEVYQDHKWSSDRMKFVGVVNDLFPAPVNGAEVKVEDSVAA